MTLRPTPGSGSHLSAGAGPIWALGGTSPGTFRRYQRATGSWETLTPPPEEATHFDYPLARAPGGVVAQMPSGDRYTYDGGLGAWTSGGELGRDEAVRYRLVLAEIGVNPGDLSATLVFSGGMDHMHDAVMLELGTSAGDLSATLAFTAGMTELTSADALPFSETDLVFTATIIDPGVTVSQPMLTRATLISFAAALGTLNLAVPYIDLSIPGTYADPDFTHDSPVDYPFGQPPSVEIPTPPEGYAAVRVRKPGKDAMGRDTLVETVVITPLPAHPAGDIGVVHVVMPSTVTLVQGLPSATTDAVKPFRPPTAYVLPPYTIWGALPIND